MYSSLRLKRFSIGGSVASQRHYLSRLNGSKVCMMRVLDFFKLAFKALMDRKVRSVLTILGIAVGSAIILALVETSTGLTAGISAQIEKTGANALTVMRAGGFFERGGGSTSSFQLSQNDVNFLLTIKGVTAVYPYYQYSATMNVGGS